MALWLPGSRAERPIDLYSDGSAGGGIRVYPAHAPPRRRSVYLQPWSELPACTDPEEGRPGRGFTNLCHVVADGGGCPVEVREPDDHRAAYQRPCSHVEGADPPEHRVCEPRLLPEIHDNLVIVGVRAHVRP